MNKNILLSALIILILGSAAPAHAAWYHWIPGISSVMGNKNPKAVPTAKNDIEAPKTTVLEKPIVSSNRPGWFSRIVTSPISAFYSRFTAWWTKKAPANTLQVREATREELEQRIQEERALALQLQQQVEALRLKEEASKKDERELEALKKANQEQQETINSQNTGRQRLLEVAADRIAAEEIKREKIEKSLQEFSKAFNANIDAFEQQANRKLEGLNTRALNITNTLQSHARKNQSNLEHSLGAEFVKIEDYNPQGNTASSNGTTTTTTAYDNQNPLAGSITQDFVPVSIVVDDKELTDSEKGFNKITEHIYMDPEYAKTKITLGKQYARKLLTGDGEPLPTNTQEDYLHAIVALNWFFYDKALKDGHGFDEGTFVIEDKNFIFYNFFMDYIKKQNPDIKGNAASDPLAHWSNNPYGYSRDASHFVHMKKYHRPYGIDMRLGSSGELPLLPAAKKHMLFGIVDPNKFHIYIKPEQHGIYYADGLPGHCGEFLTAQARKNKVASAFLKQLGYDIGTDDAEQNRKERIPQVFLQQFSKALMRSNLPLERQSELLKQVKRDGLQTLVQQEVAQSHAPEMQKLIQDYTQEYGSLENRFGREIQIAHEKLLEHIKS